MFSCLRNLLVFSLLIVVASSDAFGKVEAIRGKTYRLSAQHGPWMIMVAALKDVPEVRRVEGMSSQEAADALVYELRKKGIPSYTFRIEGQTAVMAGNFKSSKEELARRVLTFIKGYVPEFMKDQKNGAIYAATPGRPKPLSGAFLTVNPKASSSAIRSRTLDPIVKKLNSDEEYALLKNPARYSLKIATFRGSSMIEVAGAKSIDQAKAQFNKNFGSSLDESGQKAWELCQALRMAKRFGYEENYEAWVHHDRSQSYVCVGSFNSPNDPEIVKLARQFSAKQDVHQGREVTVGATVSIPRHVPKGRIPDKFWILDVKPTLTRVPGR